MSLAAVPVFLWARRLVSVTWAFVAAGLVLLIPAFALTGLVMTENAAFPVFVLAAYAIARRARAPDRAAPAGGAGGGRARDRHPLPAPRRSSRCSSPRALLKLALDWRAGVGRAELRRQATYSGLLIGVAAARGAGLRHLEVGPRPAARERTRLLQRPDARSTIRSTRSLRWTALNTGEVVLAVGVVGACALLVLVWEGAAGRLQEPAAARASSPSPLGGGSGADRGRRLLRLDRRHVVERYSFYAVPLLLLALVVWLGSGMPRPRLGTAVAPPCQSRSRPAC